MAKKQIIQKLIGAHFGPGPLVLELRCLKLRHATILANE